VDVDRAARVGERHRGDLLVVRQLGVLGAHDVEPDAGREQQLDRFVGHQQREHVDLQPGRAGRGGHLGRALRDPLQGAGQPGGVLQVQSGAHVGDGHRRVGAPPGAGRIGPGGIAERDVEGAGRLDPRVRERRGGVVALDALEQSRAGWHSQNPRPAPRPHRPPGSVRAAS
jgi:hypothetical protein